MSASYEVTASLRRWANGDQQTVEDLAGRVCMQNSGNLLQVDEEGAPMSYAAADGSQRPAGALVLLKFSEQSPPTSFPKPKIC